MDGTPFTPDKFRHVLGQYPTGVTVVTSRTEGGDLVGMAIGSFTSVSLDPPMVAFLPDRRSSSWPRIASTGRFCVNVLAADQESVCRAFSRSGADKFAGLGVSLSPSGLPILDDAVAWVDCDIERVHEAGDHDLVIGRVNQLEVARPTLPLLFFRGGYGRFAPASLAAAEGELLDELRYVDLTRAELERLAADLGTEAIMVARRDDELVFLASAGQRRGAAPTRVGERVPLAMPFGAVFLAWDGSDSAVQTWAGTSGSEPGMLSLATAMLEVVRNRGFSMGTGFDRFAELEQQLADRAVGRPARLDLSGFDRGCLVDEAGPLEVRNLSAPVRGLDGRVTLQLTIYGPERAIDRSELARWGDRLMLSARRMSAVCGGPLTVPAAQSNAC